MRTVEIKVYSFNELSEEAKQNAINSLSDINVDYDWWQYTYDDAERVYLILTEFDLGRANYCKGKLKYSAIDTAEEILKEHGEQCDTYKLAKQFTEDWSKLVAKYSDGIETNQVAEGNEYDFDCEADELEDEFLKDLLEEYRVILSNEYEYLTGEEAIIETIKANEYEFTEEGELF